MGEPERDCRVTIAGAGQILLESLELAPARVEAGWRRVGEALGAPSAELQRWASSFRFSGRLDSDKDFVACAVCGAEWGLRDGAPVAEPAGTLLTGEGKGGREGLEV